MSSLRVLVTGGTGILGRALTPQLHQAGHVVRIMSRQDAPAVTPFEWARASLETGEGLAPAVAGSDVIIHAASSPYKRAQEVDVEGTERLLAAAQQAGVGHFIYISIVGIEEVAFPYYRYKLAAEKVIEAGDVPWSIQRTTQFHNLIDIFLQLLARTPFILPVPQDLPFQPIDPSEAATLLMDAVTAGPAGRLPDAGGPEIQKLGQLAKVWRQVRGLRRPMVHLPLWGKAAAGFRKGYHTAPDRKVGRITWAEWLQRQYPAHGSLGTQDS
jgi:uncharacterized protein YbjT (DUF2867 family)